jgi:hypothetical protein
LYKEEMRTFNPNQMSGRNTVAPILHHRIAPPKLQEASGPVQAQQTNQPAEGGALSKAISSKLQGLVVKPKKKVENIRF